MLSAMIDATAGWFSTLNRSEWFDLISTLVGTVALVAAIWIAILEHKRAVGARDERVRDFRATVRSLVSTLNEKAQEVEARADDGDTDAAWEEWKHLAEDVRAGLEALLPSAPPLPIEIVAVSEMIRRLKQSEVFRGIAWNPASHAGHVRAARVDLERSLGRLGTA